MTVRRLSAALLATTAALALGACGNVEEDGIVSQGESEGSYIDVGPVKYQVQLSRILNPANADDAAYLRDVIPTEAELEDGETWFGVWLRAENDAKDAQPKVEEFEILDTLGEEYEPVLQPGNVLSWGEQPDAVPPLDVLPLASSLAEESSIQGALLLFKLPYETLENRPLELELQSPTDPSYIGKVVLDV